MPETCTSTTAQEHSFLWDDGEIATTIGRGRRISPTCVHIKISGRKRVFYFYSSCPMVCCGVVSTLFLLARHSPSKLGLCSCFGRQLFSGRSCSGSELSVILRIELLQHLSYQLTLSSSSLQGIARASSVSALASFVSCSQDGAVEPPLLCATSLTRGEP